MLVKKTHIIVEQNFWLIENGKANTITKIYPKKSTNIKKKINKKWDYIKKKTKTKN